MVYDTPFLWVVPLVGYVLVIAVVSVLAYLVLRFAIRDGMRGHTLWLERRAAGATASEDPPTPSA